MKVKMLKDCQVVFILLRREWGKYSMTEYKWLFSNCEGFLEIDLGNSDPVVAFLFNDLHLDAVEMVDFDFWLANKHDGNIYAINNSWATVKAYNRRKIVNQHQHNKIVNKVNDKWGVYNG